MANPVTYAELYGVDKRLIPLLKELPTAYWYLLKGKVIGGRIECRTGYYSGVGAQSKRVSVEPILTKACVKAGFKFKVTNVSKRGGITGQRVIIEVQDASIRRDEECSRSPNNHPVPLFC